MDSVFIRMAQQLFVGIEGGSTCSKGVLLNGNGQVLSTADAAGTNHWQIGVDTAIQRILSLVDELTEKAGVSGSSIAAAGVSLSGSDGPECAQMLSDALYAARPSLINSEVKKARLYNDTMAALQTSTDQGGKKK